MADPDLNRDPAELAQTCPDPTPLERIVQILNSMVEDVTQNLAQNNQGLLMFVTLQVTFRGAYCLLAFNQTFATFVLCGKIWASPSCAGFQGLKGAPEDYHRLGCHCKCLTSHSSQSSKYCLNYIKIPKGTVANLGPLMSVGPRLI